MPAERPGGRRRRRHPDRGAVAVLTVLAPAWAWYFLHYGYVPLFVSSTFTRAGYDAVYSGGIYRFRVLGTWTVRAVDDALGPTLSAGIGSRPEWLFALVPDLDAGLYASFVLVNLVAYVITSALLYRLLVRAAEPSWALALYGLLQIVLLTTSYLMTPYDFLAYAFLLGGIACLRSTSPIAPFLLVAVTVAGTLTRETQALALAAGAVLALRSPAGQAATIGRRTAVAAAAFVATYVGLRMALGWSDGVVAGLQVSDQGMFAILGLAAGVLAIWMVQRTGRAASGGPGNVSATLLLLLSSPYLAAVLLGGSWREQRLVVPVLLVLGVVVATTTADEEATARRRVALPRRAQAPRTVAAGPATATVGPSATAPASDRRDTPA